MKKILVPIAIIIMGLVYAAPALAGPPPPAAFNCTLSGGKPAIGGGTLFLTPTVQCTGGSGGGYQVSALIYWRVSSTWNQPAFTRFESGQIKMEKMPTNACLPGDHYANGTQHVLDYEAVYGYTGGTNPPCTPNDTFTARQKSVWADPLGTVIYGSLCSEDIDATYTFLDANGPSNEIIDATHLLATC